VRVAGGCGPAMGCGLWAMSKDECGGPSTARRTILPSAAPVGMTASGCVGWGLLVSGEADPSAALRDDNKGALRDDNKEGLG
jgi:hypothetical protein